MPFAEKISLYSNQLNDEKTLEIFLPAGYQDTLCATVSYPVVYVLDGADYGWLTASLVSNMAQSGNMPDAIVVAIASGASRVRDFTPTDSLLNWQGNPLESFNNSGGGAAFLSFLEQELIPEIDARYRTMAHRTLFGHSLGGLLALYSFLTRQGLFHNYVVSDASLWWDGQCLASLIEDMDLEGKLQGRLYCSLSDHETTGPNERRAMIEGNRRFVDALQQRITQQQSPLQPTLSLSFEHFADETHASVVLPSLHNGLNAVFKGHRLPYEWAPDVATVVEHFKTFSLNQGMDYKPPEKLVESLTGYAANLLGDEVALTFAQLNCDNYPDSSRAWSQLAAACEKLGGRKKAQEYYQQALSINPQNVLAQQGLASEIEKNMAD